MYRKGIASPIVGRAAFVPPKQDFTETLFNKFVKAETFKGTLSSFFSLCEQIELKQFEEHSTFFNSLKEKVKYWRANSLWSLLTPLAEREVYGGGQICANQRILIIGAGPCGLRTAIECAFLGAKVVVVEKRDDFSRNNVLHLWPFVIKDLRKLGAKILYPKFCPGNINHISIRKLQLLLLKICLCLGVEVHQAGFVDLIEPPEDQNEGRGWRAKLEPEDHKLSTFEFDVVIGADGRKQMLKGFEKKKAGRALAIAITFNFVNYNTSKEAKVSEIGGIAYQFRQDFFKELMAKHGIALENLVYYKDETHYFVVTAKKASLLEKGVLKEEKPTIDELLSKTNVDQDQLESYVLELAKFSTTLPKYDFEINHHNLPDVAMFDFTSVYQACHPAIIREKNGHSLLVGLVGDGLYQPFWPQGTGCGRGFMSAFNAAWMVRDWALKEKEPISILAERESLYLLLPMTPQRLSPAIDNYTIDPETRYNSFKTRTIVSASEVEHLVNPEEHGKVKRRKRKFADPWESVIAGTQRNRDLENLTSEQSSSSGDSPDEAEVDRDICSDLHHNNNNDEVPVQLQYSLKKVENSVVAADVKEERRRSRELSDIRCTERHKTPGLSNDLDGVTATQQEDCVSGMNDQRTEKQLETVGETEEQLPADGKGKDSSYKQSPISSDEVDLKMKATQDLANNSQQDGIQEETAGDQKPENREQTVEAWAETPVDGLSFEDSSQCSQDGQWQGVHQVMNMEQRLEPNSGTHGQDPKDAEELRGEVFEELLNGPKDEVIDESLSEVRDRGEMFVKETSGSEENWDTDDRVEQFGHSQSGVSFDEQQERLSGNELLGPELLENQSFLDSQQDQSTNNKVYQQSGDLKDLKTSNEQQLPKKQTLLSENENASIANQKGFLDRNQRGIDQRELTAESSVQDEACFVEKNIFEEHEPVEGLNLSVDEGLGAPEESPPKTQEKQELVGEGQYFEEQTSTGYLELQPAKGLLEEQFLRLQEKQVLLEAQQLKVTQSQELLDQQKVRIQKSQEVLDEMQLQVKQAQELLMTQMQEIEKSQELINQQTEEVRKSQELIDQQLQEVKRRVKAFLD